MKPSSSPEKRLAAVSQSGWVKLEVKYKDSEFSPY
jgi:hypothetical protein